MSMVSKLAWGGLLGGVVLLAVHGACLAGREDAPPAPAVATGSDADANPYLVITERNAFRLNPPPPPPEPPKPPPHALPEVKLSGFMQTTNQWKALLAVKVKNPDPKAAPLNSFLTLAEGDKKGVTSGENQFVVEMVSIHADQEKADIINSGTPMTLSMKDNGFASTASSPAPLPPGAVVPAARRGMQAAPRPEWQTGTN
jgi:hypothetical protein